MHKAYILPKTAFDAWVKWLNDSYKVVGPTPIHGQYIFSDVHSADDLALDYTQTVIPPKKYLVPQVETLLEYKLDGTELNAVIDAQPTVVLGIHTCDMHGIKLLDLIFSKGFVDRHYQAHRENTFIVGYECLTPCTEESFCRSMGTATAPDDVFDLHMMDLKDAFFVEVGTPKGQQLIDGFDQIYPATEDDFSRMNDTLADKWQHFPQRLDVDITEIPDLLHESYSSDYWQELGEICLACGMCTQVCPTCYCFDVKDEVDITLNAGKRLRTWDSCQIDSFATVAGGHNFRETRAARQRHRFMRKGKYQFDSTGMVGCVGCGRCATACLVNITPIKTFNALYNKRQEAEA